MKTLILRLNIGRQDCCRRAELTAAAGGIDRLIDFVKPKAKPPRELTNDVRLLRAEKCPKKPTP